MAWVGLWRLAVGDWNNVPMEYGTIDGGTEVGLKFSDKGDYLVAEGTPETLPDIQPEIDHAHIGPEGDLWHDAPIDPLFGDAPPLI